MKSSQLQDLKRTNLPYAREFIRKPLDFLLQSMKCEINVKYLKPGVNHFPKCVIIITNLTKYDIEFINAVKRISNTY